MTHAPDDLDARVGELRSELLRFRADRYPREHATVQFHLGMALLRAGQPGPAERALRTARDLFGDADQHVERAKSANMLGVALRDAGRPDEAREAFAEASQAFATAGLALEEGAARYNAGLVLSDRGDTQEAIASFERALDLLRGGPAGQAAAAARELGAAYLGASRFEEAVEVLEDAIELASRAGDRAGMGAAANVQGLARLGLDAPDGAVESFRVALTCHPRSLRPEGYAMAKANLALAREGLGEHASARLAAKQARETPSAPPPVVSQSEDVLERLGDVTGDLLEVLDATGEDDWAVELRDELVRWLDLPAAQRRAECLAWIDGEVARDDRGVDLAAAYLGVLLEFPPEAMETLIRSTLAALQDRDADARERFRKDVSRAMVRFNVPQWMRLKDTFNRLAGDVGDDGTWG